MLIFFCCCWFVFVFFTFLWWIIQQKKKDTTQIQLSHGWALLNQHSHRVSNFLLWYASFLYSITIAVDNGYDNRGSIYWIVLWSSCWAISITFSYVCTFLNLSIFVSFSLCPFASLNSAPSFIHKSCLLVNVLQIINSKIYLWEKSWQL